MNFNFDGFQAMMPDWRERLDFFVDTMRELSLQEDPEAMVQLYGRKMRQLMPVDRLLALSRRDLAHPSYRVTRDSWRTEEINPWREKHRLPLLQGGLLGDLIYGERPEIIADLRLDPGDPGAPFLEGMRSLMAIPHYDGGRSINMTVLLREEPSAFPVEHLPEHVWISNLFGRATHNLALTEELRRAKAEIEAELRVVAGIQRSLLPATLPTIPRLDLAASYQTSRLAGGDYYDIFPLPGDNWGLMIADVSGHGTPSAVMMAITHALAHSYNGEPAPPNRILSYVNDHLSNRYTADSGTFVTAFYGIFQPEARRLWYSAAGHNPPRVKRCETGHVFSLDMARGLPLGLFERQPYGEASVELRPGDQLILYTDGITEATNSHREQYGTERLDGAIGHCQETAGELIRAILDDLESFTGGRPPEDDRTLVVGKVS